MGIFTSLDLGYLKNIKFVIFTKDFDESDETVETYDFAIDYGYGSNEPVAMNGIKFGTIADVQLQSQKFVRSLSEFAATLNELPDDRSVTYTPAELHSPISLFHYFTRYISFVLTYNDSIPVDFEPKYFERAKSNQVFDILTGKPYTVCIDKVTTNHMSMNVTYTGTDRDYHSDSGTDNMNEETVEEEVNLSQSSHLSELLCQKEAQKAKELVKVRDYIYDDENRVVSIAKCASDLKIDTNIVTEAFHILLNDNAIVPSSSKKRGFRLVDEPLSTIGRRYDSNEPYTTPHNTPGYLKDSQHGNKAKSNRRCLLDSVSTKGISTPYDEIEEFSNTAVSLHDENYGLGHGLRSYKPITPANRVKDIVVAKAQTLKQNIDAPRKAPQPQQPQNLGAKKKQLPLQYKSGSNHVEKNVVKTKANGASSTIDSLYSLDQFSNLSQLL